MKNRLTLVISSFLLILCVIEKQARYQSINAGNVENMYNVPKQDVNNVLNTDANPEAFASNDNSLYNPAQLLQAVTDSSFAKGNTKLTSRGVLHSPSESKLLGY